MKVFILYFSVILSGFCLSPEIQARDESFKKNHEMKKNISSKGKTPPTEQKNQQKKSVSPLLVSEDLSDKTKISTEEIHVPTVIINDRGSPIDELSVFKSERVSPKKLKDPRRQSLADLVSDQVGVSTQVYCANCGAKRVTINGLKGEHTSVLVDGLPIHSAVSSFYGMDNIPVNGLAEVQVMRGAGASLVNPESIGGTLNLITINPLDVKNQYSTSINIDDHFTGKAQNHSLLYTLKGQKKTWGITIGGQLARTETWDEDQNNVSEMPQRQNNSAFLKTRFFLGSKNDFSLRLGHSELEILGGFWKPTRPKEVRKLGVHQFDFIDGRVDKKFIGSPSTITDWIHIKRNEMATTGTHYLNDRLNLYWKLGSVAQSQQSIYQHGFDYNNADFLFVGDSHIKWNGNSFFLKGGVFFKDQRLCSTSLLFSDDNPRDIKSDSFNTSSHAAYIQYSHLFGEDFEMDLALRADKLKINWIELVNKIDDFVLAPRFQFLHNITHNLTQRFSYGLGYRSPLTFFESQHGNNELGYQIDITNLEKAHSLVYSLSLNTPQYYVTGGIHFTRLKNMAYGFESPEKPILYKNTDETHDIQVADLLVGYKPKPWWLLESGFESFQYEDEYKIKLPTAAIEQRLQIRSSIDKGAWKHDFNATVIFTRDLSKYGFYAKNYLDRNQAREPFLDPKLQLKRQKAPTYVTLDTSLSYQWNPQLVLSFGVNNILDYTQARAGDTPSAWHWHFYHAHYDSLHTWGPNRGRQFFFKLGGEF